MTNIKSAQELLELYKTITLDWIKAEYNRLSKIQDLPIYGHNVLELITGFGDYKKCKLCAEARKLTKSNDPRIFCKCCIYNDDHFKDFHCIDETYHAICNASNPEEIFKTMKKRAEYLEKIIIKL